MKRCILLEAAARTVCDQAAVCPLIFQRPPAQGRQMLEKAQDTQVYMYPAQISVRRVNTECWGNIPLYLVTPQCDGPIQRIIFYIHGGGWVFGSFHTHEKLVRELAARTDSLVVFPEYTRSPEAKYPAAIEQCYFVLTHLQELLGDRYPSSCNSLTVAGDSAGGNMAIAMCLMAEERKGPNIQKLLLYYPVTNAYFDTPSYCQFSECYYLYRAGMEWFWDQYAPCDADRAKSTASPLRASLEELNKLPSTMIINGQADVLRSEGEDFGERLRCAGVNVTAIQVQGTIHDFVMLNALDQTNACRVAMNASVGWLYSSSPTPP